MTRLIQTLHRKILSMGYNRVTLVIENFGETRTICRSAKEIRDLLEAKKPHYFEVKEIYIKDRAPEEKPGFVNHENMEMFKESCE